MSTTVPDPDENVTAEQSAKPAQFPHEEPAWAAALRQKIEDLPGKLQATLRDEDVSKLAEGVHGLFERSGAFEPAQKSDSAEDETDEAGEEANDAGVESEPKKGGGLSGFAKKFAGEDS